MLKLEKEKLNEKVVQLKRKDGKTIDVAYVGVNNNDVVEVFEIKTSLLSKYAIKKLKKVGFKFSAMHRGYLYIFTDRFKNVDEIDKIINYALTDVAQNIINGKIK